MKLTHSIILSLGLLSTPALAQDKTAITAKPVTVSISSKLPASISFQDKPFGHKEGASVTFFLQGANMVSIDRDSFTDSKWTVDFNSRVSDSGKTGSISLNNQSFAGESSEIKIDGTVNVLVGSNVQTKKIKLKKGAKPTQLPGFTMALTLGDGKGFFGGSKGVKVIGNFDKIKSVSVKRNGKDKSNQGSSSSNDTKIFNFDDIKDGEEVTITYWKNTKEIAVKLSK